jgi:hypothetical protein
LVFPDDPRILDRTLHFKVKQKKKISVYAKYSGKLHYMNSDEYDPDSGEFYKRPKAHKRCKESDGNILILRYDNRKIKNGEVLVAESAVSGKDTYLVFPDDPRILDGTLQFKIRKKTKK